MIPPKSTVCSTAETTSGPRQGSRKSNISARILALKWLRHNADIGNAGLFHSIHNSSKDAERHILIGAQVNGFLTWVWHSLSQFRRDLIHIDRIASQKDSLLAINRYHQPRLGDFL